MTDPITSDDTLLKHYKRIIEISQQLGSTYDYMSLLRRIVAAAEELINTEAAAIILYDENSRQLRFAISSNIRPHEMDEISIPLEGSIAGWIFTHGEPRVIENVSSDPNHYSGVDRRLQFQTRNILGVPMRTPKRIIGVVQAVNKRDNARFSDDDIVTLRTLASQAAVAIENARMFQQSDFIAEMVHELRTPLMALKASTSLLERPELPDAKRGEIIGTMRRETERLISLTNDFLDVARMESGRIQLTIETFSTLDLMRECADVVQQQAQQKNVRIFIPEQDSMAEADRGKVKQVLLNLFTNAIKYNRPDGEIYLHILPIEEDGDQFVQLSVQDTGYGISREHQKNMFTKFYRVPSTENTERGTGLGLAICKHIVEAHGGRIWLESEEGTGSIFSVTIPASRSS